VWGLQTVEAGLRENCCCGRRIDFIVIAAPPTMTVQWRDEFETKFGLTFDIIDMARVAELRRLRGFSINPWTTGSRFIVSHRLLTDEVYAAGLRDVLVSSASRPVILDEAHHAAPSAGCAMRFPASLRGSAGNCEASSIDCSHRHAPQWAFQ